MLLQVLASTGSPYELIVANEEYCKRSISYASSANGVKIFAISISSGFPGGSRNPVSEFTLSICCCATSYMNSARKVDKLIAMNPDIASVPVIRDIRTVAAPASM
jgi:hypothetical protein